MKDEKKTKAQLIEELNELRQQVGNFVTDTTERKQAEETLRKSEERYTLATGAAKTGVWDWNIETGAFYLDPNIKAILGYADSEIPNDLEEWVQYVHPDDRKPVMDAAAAHLEGRSPEYMYEHRMRLFTHDLAIDCLFGH